MGLTERDLQPLDDDALSQKVAESFGWEWWSYLGRPIRQHPEYGKGDIRVRQFMSPESLKSDRWAIYFAKNDGRRADGSEPLSYCYCSSMGPAMYPQYASRLDDAKLLLDAFEGDVEISRTGENRKWWSVELFVPSYQQRWLGPNLPRLICIAYLLMTQELKAQEYLGRR